MHGGLDRNSKQASSTLTAGNRGVHEFGGASISGKPDRKSLNAKSPGEFEDNDYSLSVSDMGNSLYNSSRGANLGASDMIAPKFKY